MKQTFFLIMTAFLTFSAKGQGNLVPNGGFETHTFCPNGSSEVYSATPWDQYESADYFDTCATNNYYDVPTNWFGFQYPHSGEAYVGLATFLNTGNMNFNYREFVYAPLNDTLEPGKHYCVKFYVNVADSSRFFCSNIGVHFSQTISDPVTWTGSSYIISDTADVENNSLNLLNDSINWILVSGDYIAEGGEQYIIIGNFDTDSNCVWQDTQNGSTFYGTYLYLDDISLFEKIDAYAGNQGQICLGDSIQLGQPNNHPGIIYHWTSNNSTSDSLTAQPWVKPIINTTYYLTISDTGNLYCIGSANDSVTITVIDCTPHPPPSFFVQTAYKSTDQFFVSEIPEGTRLEIFDMRGRKVFSKENYQNDFSLSTVASETYTYRLQFPDGTYQTGKFCVVK